MNFKILEWKFNRFLIVSQIKDKYNKYFLFIRHRLFTNFIQTNIQIFFYTIKSIRYPEKQIHKL